MPMAMEIEMETSWITVFQDQTLQMFRILQDQTIRILWDIYHHPQKAEDEGNLILKQ